MWHRRPVRPAVVLAVLLLLAAAPAEAQTPPPFWSVGKVLRRLDGTWIRVGTRRVRVESDSTLCSGEGASIRRRGVRTWRHFACTYTVFTRGFVDRDLDFRLHVRSGTRFTIADVHWVAGR
jgi:hypothetical protein